MIRLSWDSLPRHYEHGVDRGVFYPSNGPGEAWNGLISVTEEPADTHGRVKYVDGIRVDQGYSPGNFAGSIEAYTYPDSFYDDNLLQKRRSTFGLSYRVNSDTGYKIHLIYNILASPSSMSYSYDEVDPFNWAFTTLPVAIPGAKSGAHLVIDSTSAYSTTMQALEDILYGAESESPRLPLPTEVLAIFDANSILQVTDHGDGTATITGPDEAIITTSLTTRQITWSSVTMLDTNTYSISSW